MYIVRGVCIFQNISIGLMNNKFKIDFYFFLFWIYERLKIKEKKKYNRNNITDAVIYYYDYTCHLN